MFTTTRLSLLAVIPLASAHFGVVYPAWRADTLENEDTYSQWEYPCSGVPSEGANRTDWPLEGGSVKLDLHHPWSYVYINLGLGTNATNFNVSLTPELMNVTGNGDFCIPRLSVPVSVEDGQNATLQFVTGGTSGSALYNCAEITFRSSARLLPSEECVNATGISAVVLGQETSATETSPSPTPGSTAGMNGANAALVTIIGLIAVLIVA